MRLQEISFPVFKLKNEKPLESSGLVYYLQESFNTDTAEYKRTIKIVDDRNVAHETLSRRRLDILANGGQLYPIRRAVYFLGDFIKLNGSGTWWIDSVGNVFEYKKSRRAKLRFFEIKQVWPLDTMGAVIEVHGLPQRFKTLFKPEFGVRWAGILDFDRNKILYGLYKEKHSDTWRLV